MTIKYYPELEQGSDEWFEARCGLLTASEMKLAVGYKAGGKTTTYKHPESMAIPGDLTAKQFAALEAIAGREGTVKELALIANSSENIIRALNKAGLLVQEERQEPPTFFKPPADKLRSHVWEIAAQRITNYIEPSYVSDDMLRGWEDEIEARIQYSEKYAPVSEMGFVTNDKWGFTLGYSPDGFVGQDGLIEAKSRRQKFQIETLVDNVSMDEIPLEFMVQIQTGLLVTERDWCDFISYSAGLPMATVRVGHVEEVQTAILEAAEQFEADVKERIAAFHEVAGSTERYRLIPTERKDDEEIVA